ncbi:MAG TPA: alpha/beta fold hydrolase [Steroidobacteraceae bacterium]|nr:alpha/beta fold hydrolase [Steroidobacteraceae bacterium]
MDAIILLHGLWMSGFVLGPMRHRLRDDYGFRVTTFSYPSVSAALGDTVARLRDLAQGLDAERLHFVGHSFGGIIVLELLQLTRDLPPGRAVLLGSPLCGSTAAATIAHWPMGRSLLGRGLCEAVVDRQCVAWDGRREVGVIAGSTGVGLGRFFAHLGGEHDGTVLVDETRLPGIVDHLVLPVTHTGMLISPEVARQAAHFLREGRFAPGEAVGGRP